MTPEPKLEMSIAEKLGASAGLWAVLWLTIPYFLLRGSAAQLALSESAFAHALLGERMIWEWVTFLRIMGGIMVIWFMGSLSSRIRLAEGEPGRLASITLAIGSFWGMVWLLSAMFNSLAIVLAADYSFPQGARLSAIFADEIVPTLTPPLVFALSLAVAFAAMRFGGFPKAYAMATSAFSLLMLVLAIVEWYGPGNLGVVIVGLSFFWIGVTSALLIANYRPADLIRGNR